MPLKRSPAATIYEVGLTRERKGEGAWGREGRGKRNLEEASYPNRAPHLRSHVLSAQAFLSQFPMVSPPQPFLSSSFYFFRRRWGHTSQTYAYRRYGSKTLIEGMEARQGWQLREPESEWRPACSHLVRRKFLDAKAFKTSFLCKHVCSPVILKRSFHLIRLSRLIKIQQFAHRFFRSGEAS